jgi:hypothetical protein
MNTTRRVALLAGSATVLVQNPVDEIRDRAELRFDPFRIMLPRRQGTRDRPAHNAAMNAELRGDTRDRANTKFMLPTELLEQFHFGFPVHKRPPDPVGGTLGCGTGRGPKSASTPGPKFDSRAKRCFLPIHVYDTATARPVAVLLRPGKTPSGQEIRGHLRRLVRRIRRHWPATHLTLRGDSHYGRPEVMAWCEQQGIDYVFGLSGNAVLHTAVEAAADDIRTRRAEG